MCPHTCSQEAAEDLKTVKNPTKSSSLGGEKKRSAHAVVPKPFLGSEMLAKKPKFPAKPKPKEEESIIVSTQKKGTARVAHLPKVVSSLLCISSEVGRKCFI